MAGKAIAQTEAQLPELAPTRDEDFSVDAADIQPPRIKAASPTTGAAADGLVPNFCVFSQKGREDDEPQILVEAGDTAGVKVYVLRMYKTKSANVNPNNWNEEMRRGGELRSWKFDDPSAPAFAKTQYNYVLYVPASEDSDLPHNLLLGNTSAPAARAINTLLAQRKQDGHPIHTQAFALWAEKREREMDGQVNRWAVFKSRPVDADPAEVAEATRLLGMIQQAPTRTVEAPVVDAEPAPSI